MTDHAVGRENHPTAGARANPVRAIAFHLPQFHPTPENDEWWGKGFTEWTNVAKALPRYSGHYQPHVPADLGFYDLRLKEAREAQANLAVEYGVSAFCYYHYWFMGERFLDAVTELMLREGTPDTPFVMCWANEDWTRAWVDQSAETLRKQTYSAEDDRAHFEYLLPFFQDPRYLRVAGKPLFLVYLPGSLPDAPQFAQRWRDLAEAAGLPGIHLAAVEAHSLPSDPAAFGFDSSIGFLPTDLVPYDGALMIRRTDDEVIDYDRTVERSIGGLLTRSWPFAPAVVPRWDNTPRRATNARIYANASPETFERWVAEAGAASRPLDPLDPDSRFLFVVAWNEWAEGNHLEPDERYGHRFGHALRDGLARASGQLPATPEATRAAHRYAYQFSPASHLENVVQHLGRAPVPGAVIVDLGAGFGPTAEELASLGWGYLPVEVDPVSVAALRQRGHDVIEVDLESDRLDSAIRAALGESPLGGLLLLDVLEHLADPRSLLASLHKLSRPANAPLIVSVPNVTHFDVAVGALLGRWRYRETGVLDVTHLRFFDRATLLELLSSEGFEFERANDFEVASVDSLVSDALDQLPAETLNTLDILARAANPSSHVRQFIWRTMPVVRKPDNPGRHESGLVLAQEPEAADLNIAVDWLRRRSAPRSALGLTAMLQLERRVNEQSRQLAEFSKELDERAAWALRLAAERDEMATWAQALVEQNNELRSLIEKRP